MSDYKILAESYKDAIDKGICLEEEVASAIKVFEFLDNCSEEDICNLFDSSAFNEIILILCRRALDKSGFNDTDKKNFMDNINNELDRITSFELLE